MNRIVRFSRNHFLAGGLALGVFVPLACAHAADNTVYTFTGGNDGANPDCGLVAGGKGVDPAKMRFYGATEAGGTHGFGTIYEINGPGSETVVYSFTGGTDGASPVGCPTLDSKGSLYGTTEEGGAHGFGVVFKLTPGGTESVLYSFKGGSDGAYPLAGLVMDAKGNLYGTTQQGGADNLGTVFELESGKTESVLFSFAGSSGAYPVAGLTMDANDNLYGTTSEGGEYDLGTVFEIASGGGPSLIHAFKGGSDGEYPYAGVILDKKHNIYGTTSGGGTNSDGTVFEITHKGREMVLHSFAGGSDGADPVSGVMEVGHYLYGTTASGGTNGAGTVFKTSVKTGSDTVLYSFTGGSDGGMPKGGVLDLSGNLFGTTFAGGDPGCASDGGCGVAFEITP
jgi:uncharacterized repeat protein (TIGR03803 family)